MKDISKYYRVSLKCSSEGVPAYTVKLEILKGLPFHRKSTVSLFTMREALAVISSVHDYIARLCSDYYLFDGVIEFADRVLNKAVCSTY